MSRSLHCQGGAQDVEDIHVPFRRLVLSPGQQNEALEGPRAGALETPSVAFARIVGLPNIRQRPSSVHGWKWFVLLFCETVVLITLKLYFIYQMVRFAQSLSGFTKSTLNKNLFSIGDVLLGLCAALGAEALWTNKESIRRLLAGQVITPSQSCFWKRFQVKYLPYLLFFHATFGICLFFVANTCYWPANKNVTCSLYNAVKNLTVFKVVALAQVYVTMTIYCTLCLYLESVLSDISETMHCQKKNISYRDLQAVYNDFEKCSHFMEELSKVFVAFIFFWYILLCGKAFFVFSSVFGMLRNTKSVSGQELCVPVFELSYLLILCLLSLKIKLCITEPARDIQDVIMNRSAKENELHVECQRYMHRIESCASMTLWKFSSWTETVLRIGAIFLLSCVVVQIDGKDRMLKDKLI